MTTTAPFTDRDERRWQRRAEERAARPLPVAARVRALRAAFRLRTGGKRRTPVPEGAGTGVREGPFPQATG
ncbi:hypothetical protein ACIQRS_22725 [Streptomyces termitum]|uniref:Uncharacterized protein n=1 Tax=Streptomyces termitum TaxID=67368 RepID=A0A918T4W7_9ACTN|nr:hypothetical protein [Streptomyces termitum]GHA93726.1 hypothetical protein GCM10010305_41910 [Streptomyces termitum]